MRSNLIRTIRLVAAFYLSFAFASALITISCLAILYRQGITAFAPLFWFKLTTFGLIFLYVDNFRKNEYFYYKNLGLTKKHLWIAALTFDVVLYVILVIPII